MVDSMNETTSPLALISEATYRSTCPRAAGSTLMVAVASLTKLPPAATQPSAPLNCWLRGPTLMLVLGAARVSSMQSARRV